MISRDEYRALRAEPGRWRHAVADICALHAIPADGIRALGGSNMVASVGDAHIVKLFPPFLRFQWDAERVALLTLDGRLSAATPQLRHQGERDGWPYLVMTKLPGTSLADVWPGAAEGERIDILAQIGALIAEVQRVPPGPLARVGPSWDERIAAQLAACEARHARLGLPEPLLRDLRPYLDRALARGALPAGFAPAILTGEHTPENLLVERRGGRWVVTGLVDFGDAMVGPGDYDLLGPSTFLAAGRRDRVRSLFLAAGKSNADLAPALAERLLVLLLLHRHSDLDLQIAIDGWRDRVGGFDDLAALLWPFGAA